MVFEKKTSPLITTAASTINNNNGHDDNSKNKIKNSNIFHQMEICSIKSGVHLSSCIIKNICPTINLIVSNIIAKQ